VSLPFLHGRIATALVLFTLAAGVYGLAEYLRKKPISPSYWGLIIFGNLLALVQGSLGGWMALQGAQPTRGWLHILYGVVTVLWIPAIRLLNRHRAGRDATLTCTLVSLFEFAVALQAMGTA
jgi:heme A synthase